MARSAAELIVIRPEPATTWALVATRPGLTTTPEPSDEDPQRVEVADTWTTESRATSAAASDTSTFAGSSTGGRVAGLNGRLGTSIVARSSRASSSRAPPGPARTWSRSGKPREARTCSDVGPRELVATTESTIHAHSRKARMLTTMPEALSSTRIGRKSTASRMVRPANPRMAWPITPRTNMPARVAIACTNVGHSRSAIRFGTSHAPHSAPPMKPAKDAAVVMTPERHPAIATTSRPTSSAMSIQFPAHQEIPTSRSRGHGWDQPARSSRRSSSPAVNPHTSMSATWKPGPR